MSELQHAISMVATRLDDGAAGGPRAAASVVGEYVVVASIEWWSGKPTIKAYHTDKLLDAYRAIQSLDDTDDDYLEEMFSLIEDAEVE